MKIKYLLFVVLVIILVIIGIVIYTSQKTDIERKIVQFTIVENSGNKTILSKIPLDEASAKILAEKAISVSEEADYKDECLIFDSVEKKVDARNTEEFWSVEFRCNDECNEIYLNCGATVLIKERTREVTLGFPN